VVVQIAISLVVLSAAALFARHLSNLKTVGVGFDSDSVLLVSLDPTQSGQTPGELSRLYGELLARLETIPGVESATLSGVTPIHGAGASRFVKVEGHTEDPSTRRFVAVNWVAPRYFQTFRTPLVAGRDFRGARESGPPVAIINQSMARHYFGDTNPLGRHFTFDKYSRRYEIVGVVGDAKYYNLHDPAPKTVYLDAFQDAPGRSHVFSLRTSVPPLRVAGEFRTAAQEVVKNVTVRTITTLEDQVNASLVNERVIVSLSNTFATVATILAALGLYGLLAFTVVRRTGEIGVRMALGATPGDVIRLVVGGAAGLLVAGVLIGAPLALWMRRVAAGLIPNLSGEMTTSFAIGLLILILAAALAAYLPARRATRVDPVEALRHS
jgi:predicted permease